MLILDIKHWDYKPQIGTYKFDLIHYLMENGLRHASGPFQQKNPIRYIYVLKLLKSREPNFWFA